MRKKQRALTAVAQSKLPLWVVWVAYGACAWAFLFAALSCYWALGGMVGVDTAVSPHIAQLARAHAPGLLALLWITALVKVFSGFIALALVQSWGSRVPHGLLLILVWGAGTLLFVHGGLFLMVGILALSGTLSVSTPSTTLHWYTFLWGPWWLLGGLLFLMGAWSFFLRSPHRPVNFACSILGVLGALFLLILSGGTIG